LLIPVLSYFVKNTEDEALYSTYISNFLPYASSWVQMLFM